MQTDIKSMTREELKLLMCELKEPSYRAAQLYEWMHGKLVREYDQMTNLPRSLRNRLAEEYPLCVLKTVRERVSARDGTRKYLFALPDGNLVESVWMRYHHGNSVCISSQVGCRMGCAFCASTLDGWERNLLPSEMLEQIYAITLSTGERVSNVVVMGTGEPLDNYENLLRFISLLTGEGGLHISQRNVTVSTCGIAPAIRRLAEERLQITLALSLHAATDAGRSRLMPVNHRYPLNEVISACSYYHLKTGRRVTFEYALIAGVNDGKEDVACLARLASRLGAHVNLIPVNPIKERNFRNPDTRSIGAFKKELEKQGINVTIRREMGRDIDGACGQLRRSRLHQASDYAQAGSADAAP